jgi:leucyl-tRNA synthetase
VVRLSGNATESKELQRRVDRIKLIELEVQRLWDKLKPYEVDPIPGKPKKLVTFPYPYMNGPLHVGHALSATRADVYARFMRLKGYNVLFPFAWHWTGEPIVGISKGILRGEPRIIDTITKIDGVPASELQRFTDPYYVASYYTNEGKKSATRLGLSVDWRREFTTAHNEGYTRFITWQYSTLKEKGFITQGTHPVVWCPNDKSPTGDHDRAEGEGVSPDEMFLIKFPLREVENSVFEPARVFLVAATYRPETVFGATNVWLRPNGEYVEAEVDGEKWVVSEYSSKVLGEQKHSVNILRRIPGQQLVGRSVANPITGENLPILPADFVDTSFGTGVVYSVPAHAPYDYLALRDLQRLSKEQLLRLGLAGSDVQSIKPISIIKVEGYGDYPAIEECERLGVVDQNDAKAQRATEQIYKIEYNKGVMRQNCDGYSGKPVSEAKTLVFSELTLKGYGATYLELPKPVVCRCGWRCIVKILENQWFLKYGDSEWKQRVRAAFNQMRIYPPEARQWFNEVVDWLQDKACARKSGMGTPLPWDNEWIVETLSDSTVYMAYYPIAKYVNSKQIAPSSLTRDFFDYVYYGLEDVTKVAEKTGVSVDLLLKVRAEFLYWYPVDLRNSAKELISNHLTFYVFHHCALFPRELWPKAISVNGLVNVGGEPMHKSKGNFVPMKDALDKYGADATRCTLVHGTEDLEDPDWTREAALNSADKLYSLTELVDSLVASANDATDVETKNGQGEMDGWLLTKLKKRAAEVSTQLDEMRTRSAFNTAFYQTWEDYRHYLKRSFTPNKAIQLKFFKGWAKLLHPFAPHVSQWIFNRLGEQGLIEFSGYPETATTADEEFSLVKEEYLQKFEEDLSNLSKLISNADAAEVVVASPAKIRIAQKIISNGVSLSRLSPEIIKLVAEETGNKTQAAAFAQRLIRVLSEWRAYPPQLVAKLMETELQTLKDASHYLQRVHGIAVSITTEERAGDSKRGANATPLKPAVTLYKKN